MSENINHDDLGDHNVSELIRGAYEEAISNLAHEATEDAETITYESGVIAPYHVLRQADSITYLAGVIQPKATIEEAEAITRHAAEVLEVGEDLYEGEELDSTITEAASSFLYINEISQAYRTSSLSRGATKYLQTQAKNQAKLDELNKRISEKFKHGKDDF